VAIFAAGDSSDVWSHPGLFWVDADGLPEFVAGVPPDYFSPTGQLWGNPLYRWEEHRRSGYDWWLRRLETTLKLVDIVRIDHFRGFAAYWEIRADARTAEVGRWVAGPAEALLEAMLRRLGSANEEGPLPFVAEDLGVITPDVMRLLERFRLPGMRVLQFAFSGLRDSFLPHNYVENSVAYTGTHDNNTTRGWFETSPRHERDAALAYLRSTPQDIVQDMVRAIWSSKAAFAIVPMQDLLELGTEARMNYPGQPEGNWAWRLRDDQPSQAVGDQLKWLNSRTDRNRD
jgi:4-alpha-glucanotransferase